MEDALRVADAPPMSDATGAPSPRDHAGGSSSAVPVHADAVDSIHRPPRCIPTLPLHERQLAPAMIELQRAAAVAHRKGQRLESAGLIVAISLALAGITVTLADVGTDAIAVLGFAWFLASSTVLHGAAIRSARTSALLQEQFDVSLFYLPWRDSVGGSPMAPYDIPGLARELEPGSVRDQRITDGWYDPVDAVHHPYDVLIAQEQNLGWDIRLRRRYANTVMTGGILWAILGGSIGYAVNAGLADTVLGFYVPSLAVFRATLEIWHGQRKVATERERLIGLVTSALSAAVPEHPGDDEWTRLRDLARNIQDGVLRTRMETTRVPEWLYKRYRSSDEEDFARTAENRRSRLAATRPCPKGSSDHVKRRPMRCRAAEATAHTALTAPARRLSCADKGDFCR